jgi:hypothetical protein
MHPLVGRQSEWKRLLSSWQRAKVGESHLFLISGEAGIGRSRLAEGLLTWAGQAPGAISRECWSQQRGFLVSPAPPVSAAQVAPRLG